MLRQILWAESGLLRIRSSFSNNLGDVWYTDDLITWHLYAEDLINLHASACAFDEKNLQIVIVGGKGGVDARNDRGAVTNHVIGLPVTIELLDVVEN